jgi:hypothetical protein
MPCSIIDLRIFPGCPNRTIGADPKHVHCGCRSARLHRVTLFIGLGEETDRMLRDVDRSIHIDERLVGAGDVHDHGNGIIAGGVRIINPQHQLLPRELICVHAHLLPHSGQGGKLLQDQANRARVPRINHIEYPWKSYVGHHPIPSVPEGRIVGVGINGVSVFHKVRDIPNIEALRQPADDVVEQRVAFTN